MKNRFFVVVLMVAVVALGVSSCGKKNNDSNAADLIGVRDAVNGVDYTLVGDTWSAVYAKCGPTANVSTIPGTVTVGFSISEHAQGQASVNFSLAGGGGEASVTITAQDGTPKTWKISATTVSECP